MAEPKNPLTEKVKKMVTILEAGRKAGEKVEEERAKVGQAETGQPSGQGGQSLS